MIFFILIVVCISIIYIVCQFFKFYLGHDYMFGFTRLFDLNEEANIPSVFSSLILLLSSIILTIIALLKARYRESFFLHWSGLATLFFFLFIDEAVSLHELLTTPVRMTLNASAFFYYAWIIPYGMLLLLFIIGYYKFILHLPAKIRFLFIIAGITYIIGAIGFEMFGGYYDELYSRQTIIYAVCVLFEESLEMTGIVLFIYSLLLYLTLHYKKLLIEIEFSNN